MIHAAKIFAVLLAATGLLVQPALADKRVALVIGNGAYEKVPELPNPPRDAADIGRALERLDFKVTQVRNATAGDMRKAVVDFGRAAEGSDMAVVFYAGHGMEVGGENWLIPISAELRSDADIESEAVSLRSISVQVSKARQLGLVILDACRNNPFAAKMKRSIATRAVSRGLAPSEPSDNVLIAYAARDGTTASDGDGKNSPFTSALLKHIETPGLEISFLFRRVRDDVMSATKREQQPFVYGSLSKEEIYLRAPVVGAVAPLAVTPTAPVLSDDEKFWQAIRTSTVAGPFEQYASRFPKGSHVDEARARIKDFKSKQVAAVAPVAPLPAAAAKQAETSTATPRGRNDFAAPDARKVAEIASAQDLVLPVFSIDVTDAEAQGPNAKYIGVWSSNVGWGEGKGRKAMLIIKGVSDTGLVRGYFLWGPPGKESRNREPAGNKWFSEYMVNDKFSIKTTPEIVARLDEKNVLTLQIKSDNPAERDSVELRPVWQLVRTGQDAEPSANASKKPESATSKPADRSAFTDGDGQKVATIATAQKLVLPNFNIAPVTDGPLGTNAKYVGVWSSKQGWNGKGRYAMIIITAVSDTGLANGYYLWGPPVKESWTRDAAGSKWFAEYIVNDKFSIKTSPEITARFDKNVLAMSTARPDKPSEKSSIELRPVWQLVRARQDAEPTSKREQAPRQARRR